MKKLLIIILWLIGASVSATKYYVSPTGTDGAYPTRGTLANPWLTWDYAFNHTTSSDTCYFRGGTYASSTGVMLDGGSNGGTFSHPTCFFNYPAEVPILDCQTMPDVANEQVGVAIRKLSHLYLKGLTVKNVRQNTADDQAMGFFIAKTADPTYNCNNIRLENCTAHHIGGHGFYLSMIDTMYLINCDAYNICDSLTTYDPGGFGTGFGIYNTIYGDPADDSYVYLQGCRGWKCSDQGFSSITPGLVIYDGCWGVNNGHNGISTTPKGSGFKIWYAFAGDINKSIVQIMMHNCLTVDNEMRGFNVADESGVFSEIRTHLYNNFAYRNGGAHYSGDPYGQGFYDQTNVDTVGRWDHKYKNNLSFDNFGGWPSGSNGDYLAGMYVQATNEWDIPSTTVTAADFVSLDTTGLCGARQSDGSLPVTTFGHLASTSELINAGTDVGLPYNGAAPDIGWVEYAAQNPAVNPVVITVVSVSAGTSNATIGCNVTDDGGGTVSDRGVCWGTSANPTITGSHNNNGTGVGVFNSYITGLTANTTYHVRGFATNEAGTAYTADSQFTTGSDSGLSGDPIFVNGKMYFTRTGKILYK